MDSNRPTLLILFGVTGDLSRRYLLPAINSAGAANLLPKQFRVIGITRQQSITAETLLCDMPDADYLRDHLQLHSMDVTSTEAYEALHAYLTQAAQELGGNTQQLFYLSLAPEAAYTVIERLGVSPLAKNAPKILLEKPFGTDLQSAVALDAHIQKYFRPETVYRVDHYAAKEPVQSIIDFRNAVSFAQAWDNGTIEKISITANESIGIENRAAFYEQTGALRDMLQSHLLQVLALLLIPLSTDRKETIPELRLAALRQLYIADVQTKTWRAQYAGYADEVKNRQSATETFASIELASSDPNWTNVPMTLTSGKALDKKSTQVVITFHDNANNGAKELVVPIYPDTGITLDGTPITYQKTYAQGLSAYEHVLLDAIRGNRNLFVSGEEVLASWRIVDKVLALWKNNTDDLARYQKGETIEQVIRDINAKKNTPV